MTTYYFHLHECGKVLEDREGVSLPDIQSATACAIKSARGIMASEILAGELCLGCHIEIEQRDAGVVRIVRFADVIKVSGVSAT